MQESSKAVVAEIVKSLNPKTLLDCPSGGGWLAEHISKDAVIDGIDLYAETRGPYRELHAYDLDNGLPSELGEYDVIACCEGIEHFGNPELFFRHAHQHLKTDGTFIVTTPNIWYPGSKMQYGMRGFYPGFPNLAGKIKKGTHMHIMPWSFPQLYLFLTLTGFVDITLHEEPMSRPKHWFERILGFPQKKYCERKMRKANTAEERRYWQQAGSQGSVMGRHLIVTARPKALSER